MCGFPRGVTNILDPAQTGQPWTPERIQQFGGLDPATARASGLTEQGYPLSSFQASVREGPAAQPISGTPSAIPTNPSTRAAGEGGAPGAPPLRKTLLGG